MMAERRATARGRARTGLAAWAAGLLLALLASVVLTTPAVAEPYLAVRAGAKCNDCHTNLTGGGKRTPFATIHAHDVLHDLDLIPIPAGVRPFSGEITDWFSVGADLRVRNTYTFEDEPDADGRVSNRRFFRDDLDSVEIEMEKTSIYSQLDLWPDMLTFYTDLQVAPGGANARELVGILNNVLPWGLYLKAGRFFPTYGVRIEDDTSFIRSQTGFTFDNPDDGAEIGIIRGPLYAGFSVTNGTSGDSDVLLTANSYVLFDEVPVFRNVLAGASMARQSDDRYESAFYVGANLWRFTYLGEVDIISDDTPETNPHDQLAAYAEVNLLLFDWLNVRGTFDYVKVQGDNNQNRFGIGLEPFISRFLQPRLVYQASNGPRQDPEGIYNNANLFLELHLFF
jgi:hypothetical protein